MLNVLHFQSLPGSGMHHSQLLMSLRDREKAAASASGGPSLPPVKVSLISQMKLRGNVGENQRGAPTYRHNLGSYSGYQKYS